jgi:GcrA cell cycle regulator
METLSRFYSNVQSSISASELGDRPAPIKRAVYAGAGGGWVDERVELLTKLWADGLSASQIATRMGGISRNAVIGKVHRLGLTGRAERKTTTRRHRRAPVKAVPKKYRLSYGYQQPEVLRLPVAPLPAEVERPAKLVAFDDLQPNQCAYAWGDPKHADFGFCGRDRAPGTPYCDGHHRLCSAGLPEPRRRGNRRDGNSSLRRIVTPIAFEVLE